MHAHVHTCMHMYTHACTCTHMLVIAMSILFSEVAHKVSTLCKQEVPHTCSEYDGQEQPAIVSHGHQHQQVSKPNLDHVESRLGQMHSHTDGIIPETGERGKKFFKYTTSNTASMRIHIGIFSL